MVEYIKKIATDIIAYLDKKPITSGLSVFGLTKALAEEINKLDPRDFAPAVQYDFVATRVIIRELAAKTSFSGDKDQRYSKSAINIISILDSYLGEASYISTRKFEFISDLELKRIIERDY